MQSASNTQKFGLRISDISCKDLPNIGTLWKRPGSFYLKATIAGTTGRTYVVKHSSSPSWEDPLNFDLEGSGQLMIQVIDQHQPGKPKLIGELTSPIEISGDFQGEKKYPEQRLVHRAEKKTKDAGSVSFTLTRLSYLDASESVGVQTQLADASASKIERAVKAEGAVGGLSEADKPIENATNFAKSWKPLLDYVGILIKIGDAISGIDPYAKMAWSILSPALKAIEKQKERDETILGLLDAMNNSYDFVDLTKPLRIEDLHDTRKEIIKKMLQQTYDCAWFIRDYTSRGFFGRAVDGMTSDHDSIVKEYIKAFDRLKECFKDGSLVGIEVTVHRTLAVAQKIYDRQILRDMALAADRELPKECLPSTREAILEDIIDWIHRPSASPEEPEPCVYWLHGVAGCGKSAIASTIAQRFKSLGRCAWYFFDASRQSEAGPRQAFSTLSRMLADMDEKWREALVKIVEPSQRLQSTQNVKEQFENFILGPAKQFEPMGPVVVVIDALDESGSRDDRATLLQMLGRLGELGSHGQFRFLITSRPEEDILPIFTKQRWVLSRDLTTIDESSTEHDIRQYVDAELSHVRALTRKWPDKPWVNLIVARAEHLFQWASVACAFIKGAGKAGVDPVKRYERLRDDRTDANLTKLDQLYTTVLRNLYGSGEDDDEVRRFCKVLGRVLCLREPLSLESLTELRSEEEDEEEIERIVCSLGSLLKGVDRDNNHEPIQPLHASFIDFLSNHDRSGVFHVDTGSQNMVLAHSCLRVMNQRLRFNICDLESSYLPNRDVEDLPNRIRQNIPEYLAYACRYFADHLNGNKSNEEILNLIHGFLQEKLLFWFEALSLLKNISQAFMELSAFQACVTDNAVDENVKLFIEDAIRFVRAYGGTMEKSTPHIYVSLLAFIPPESPLHKAYSGDYPGRLKVASNGGQPVKWTSSLLQIPTSGSINAVGFSPNGKLIVSGSDDSTVRVWDVHTGQSVGDPFQGHTESVNSVGFSPDSKLVVSGSYDKTVRVWDVYTGQQVGDPFQGHTSWVNSVGFSPDGKLVVSGSHDWTVRVWDVHTVQPVGDPFQGHTESVNSVGFSPNGKLVVSGSNDKTVRVWDVHTGQPVGDPFQGHTSWTSSVGFSPDGKLVISGSNDSTVRVWDVYTGQPVGDPFQGHTSSVSSVGFSPDGKLVVYGSHDSTVRVWDMHTGQSVGDPFQGHTSWVNSVGLSPDGKLVVSGSSDWTVRVWDVHTGQQVGHPFQGHTLWISSVGFSPDGKLIVSGSSDSTVRVWDVHTGQPVGHPFQGHTSSVNSVGFSPDGKLVVSGSNDSTVRVWDIYTGQPVGYPFQGHTSLVNSVGFSPNGKLVVSGSSDWTVRVWDVYTGQQVGDPFQGHTSWVNSVGFSPDGKLVVSGSDDSTIRVWDVYTGQPVGHPFQGYTDWVNSVGFSPDGKLVVSGSRDSTVRVWDVHTGQPVGHPFRGHISSVNSVGFSPDGKLVVSGSSDRTVRVWDVHTGQPVGDPFQGHTLWISSVGFSPDGKLVVSGSSDKTVRVWDVHTGQPVGHPFQGHTDWVNSVGFLPDGKLIVSGSGDKTIRVCDMQYKSSFSLPDSGVRNNIVCYTDSSILDNDGWIQGQSGELLFWVPPSYRTSLWRPSNIAVIGENSVKLDFSRFTHGTDWHQCKKI